jgi:hypothetical protein
MTAQTDFEKGKKLFDDKQFVHAVSFLEKDLLRDNSNLKTIEIIGDAFGQLKKWDKALFYYQKLSVLKPQEANYWYKYGGVLGMKAKDANKFAALGMIPDVKAAFEKTIQLNPKHLEARYALIELYLQLPGIVGGSERKARKYADEIATISTVDGYFAKGRIEEYVNNFAKAEIQYRKAFDVGKSKTAYQKLYDLYKKNSKMSAKAIALKQDFESK